MANARTIGALGIICMVWGAMFSAMGVWETLSPSMVRETGKVLDPTHWRIAWLMICWPGILAGQPGYYLSAAAGKNLFTRLVMASAIIGSVIGVFNGIFSAMLLETSPLQLWSLLLGQWLSTFLLGIAALIAKNVPLWKRIWPIWTGIAPQILFPLYIFVLAWPPFLAWRRRG